MSPFRIAAAAALVFMAAQSAQALDTIIVSPTAPTATVGNSIVFVLSDDGLGDGVAAGAFTASTGAFPLNWTLINSSGTSISGSGSSITNTGVPFNNGTSTFLIVSSTATTTAEVITLAATVDETFLPAATVTVTFTAGALDHFDMTVNGTTTPNVGATAQIACRAEDAFGNLITTYVSSPTVALLQNDLSTLAAGAPSPTTAGPFVLGQFTLNVSDNYAEGPIAVRLTDTVSSFADKRITWQQQQVTSYTVATTPVSITAGQAVTAFNINSLTVQSGLKVGDTVVLTFPGDWTLNAAATTTQPADFSAGAVSPAARTVTWTRNTSFLAPGDLGNFSVSHASNLATTFTQGQSVSVATTTNTARTAALTINAFGALGLKAPPPPGGTANANTAVLLQILNDDSYRESFQTNEAGVNYTFRFRTTTALPASGTLVVDFEPGTNPSDFGLSGVRLTAWTGIDGSASATINNATQQVFLVRDGTGSAIPGGTIMEVRLEDVTNPPTASSSPSTNRYSLTLETYDAPFTGTPGPNLLDSAGPAIAPTNRISGVDFRPNLTDEISFQTTPAGFPNLAKGTQVTFAIQDLDLYEMTTNDKFFIVLPPFGPNFTNIGGGFVVNSAPADGNLPAAVPVQLFGSSSNNAAQFTAPSTNDHPDNDMTITVTLPNYTMQGVRFFIMHESTDNEGGPRCFAVTPTFNVVDTGNLVITATPPARLTTAGARVASSSTNTGALYDLAFTHSVAVPTDGFVDVTTLAGDSFWSIATGASGMKARNLILTGVRFGADYRGVGGAGADDTANTDANGSVHLQLVRGVTPDLDVVEVRSSATFGAGTLLASGTMGTGNGLGFVTLVADGGSGVSGSVVITARATADDVSTATPSPVTQPANFEPHSVRIDSGRSTFRWRNMSGSPIAASAKTFVIGDSASDLVTLSTLPQAGSAAVQIVAANGTTVLEGPTSTPFSATGQAIEGPGGSSEPTITISQDRTYETVTTTTVRFATHSEIPAGGSASFNFPAGFVVTPGALTGTWLTNPRETNVGTIFVDPTGTIPAGSAPTATFDAVGQTLVLTNTGLVPVTAGYHTVTFTSGANGLRNPSLPGSFSGITMQTVDGGSGPLDPAGPGAATATSLPALTINGHTIASTDPIVAASAVVTPLGTGDTATCTVTFTTKSDIPVVLGGGVLRFRFIDPDGSLDVSATNAATWSPTGNPTNVVGSFTVAGSAAGTVNPELTLTRTGGGGEQLLRGAMVVSFTIKNPRRSATSYAVQVETSQTAGLIDQSDGVSPTFTTTGGAVTAATLTGPLTATAGSDGATYDVTFATQSFLPPGAFIELSLPPGTTFDSPAATAISQVTIPTFVGGGAGSLGVTPTLVTLPGSPPTATVLRITNDSGQTIRNGSFQLQVSNIRNTTRAGTYGVSIRTLQSDEATVIDASATTTQQVTVQGGTFTATSSPATVTAGATSTPYQFDYRLNADVVAGNALDVGFPLGFNVGAVGAVDVTLSVDDDGVAPYTTVPGASYTVAPQGDNVTVRLTMAATIDASSTPFVRITITDVRNTTFVAPHTYTSLRTVNTGNGTTIDSASVLPTVTVDGAGFAAGSVTYGVAPAAADQETATHAHTFQMGSTLPSDGLVTVVFEDAEVKLADSLTTASTFTGTAGDAITWAGIDGGYRIRAIHRSTIAGVSSTGLVLERDPGLGANGDTSPVRHAIQLVNVVTNTSVLGATRYRIDSFRNTTTLRPRLRADGASGTVTFVSTTIDGATQVFNGTDLTGAIYLEVTGLAGARTITAFRDVGRNVAAQVGLVTGVLDTQAGVVIPCTVPSAFNIVVNVAGLAGGEVDVVETLWRIDPPNVTAAGNEDQSLTATIMESLPQNVNDVVSPPAKGAASTHTISFTTPVIVRGVAPAQHTLRIELDKGAAQTSEFSFANVAASPGTNFAWTVNGTPVPGANYTVITDPAPNPAVLWVTYTGAADLPSGNHVITLQQVLNSNDEGTDFFARVSLYRRINTTPNPDILDPLDLVLTETNTPSFSLSGAQLTNVTASPTESRAARPSGYTFRFRSLTQIPATGQVRIVFPKDALDLVRSFNLASLDGKVLSGAVGSWFVDLDNNGTFEQALAGAQLEVDPADASGSTLVLSRKDAVGILGNGTTTVGHEIIILNDPASNVVNVDTKGSYSLAMSTHSYGGADETPGSIIEGPNQSSPPFNLVGDVVTVTAVTLAPSASGGAAAQHTVTFTTSTRLPNNAKLVFTYDGGADTWGNITPGFVSGSSTPDDLINFAFSAGVLSADRDAGGASLAPGTYSVVLTGFTNSTNRHREHRITLETRDALNVPIDLPAAVLNTFPPKFIVQPGQLTGVVLTPTPTTAGNDSATHAIDLTTVSAIPKDGRIFVRYSDEGFDLTNVVSPEVTLSGVADPTKITVETATATGRIVIKLDGTLPSDLAPATRTLTIQDVTNTLTAASNHTAQVVVLAGGLTVPVANEPFAGPVAIGGSINLALVNGQPPVVVPGTVIVSTGAAFVVDEIAGTITFPAGSAAGDVSYSRYPEVVATSIGSPVQVDLAATSATFSITGGPATKIRFDNLTSGSVRNRQSWPNTFSFQLLDAADNPTTQTGGNPIVLSFASTETALTATLQWAGVAGGGGTASVPLASVSPAGVVILDQMSFRGRLTGTEASPGFNKADIDLAATIGGTPLTVVGVVGTNRVKVIPGDFTQVAWPDTIAQQTVDSVFTGTLILQALDADGNRPTTPTTTPNLRVLPRIGAGDETVKGAILNLSGGGDQVDGAALDGGVGTFDLVANGAKYVGPTGVVFLHVHQVLGDTHVATIDTDASSDAATFLPRDPIQVTFVSGVAARVNWTLASAFGRRVSGGSPGTSLSAAGSPYQFTVALNGDTPAPTAIMVLGADITNDGPALAAAIQTAIRNMTASAPSLQNAYSQARVAFTGGRYVVISGLTTNPSSVGSIVDTTGTAMDTVKLTDGQGASGLAGDPAALYTVDSLFPAGAAFELQDAGGNPTTNVGPDFIRLRLTSTSNPGFDTPRLSYEAPTAAVLPAVMTEATPLVDFVDLLPPGTTTNLGNVLRYGGGHNNGLPMRMSVLVAREDAGSSPRTVLSTVGSPLSITQTAADWAPGNLVGKTVLFTSGPAFGRRAVIAANTADTLTIVEPLAPSIRTLTGAVSVLNGDVTVTGLGTLFTSELLVGHRLTFASDPGVFYTVQAIGSDTSLTLSANYTGTSSPSTAATRGGAPLATDTIEIYTTTELSLVTSQVDGVDNTVVFTPAKVARFTLTGLVGFRVNLPNGPATLQAQDRYGNLTNNVGAGAVFSLAASPPPVGAPFAASNIIKDLPDGGGTSVLTNRFTNGVATVSPTYLGAALADGSQQLTIGITVDGGAVTVNGATHFVDAGSPRHIRWVGLQGQTLHAGRPLNDSASPTGLGAAGAGPWQAQLFDAAGNAVAASDVPAAAPNGIRVDVVNGGGLPNLDLSLADNTQTDSVTFGSGNVLSSGAFSGNTADLAAMRFLGRASQSNGQALSATLVEPGPVETLLIPVTFAPAANPAANPTFTVKPGALAHFHWGLSNGLVQQPSQALDPGGNYLVHAHDENHNRLGATGETYEGRPNTPLAGAGFDLTTNAGTTPELVYLFAQNVDDLNARLNFGPTDPGVAAPLLGRVRLDKTGTTPFAWSGGTFRLGPSPDADLRYFGINGDVQVNADVGRVTPGRTIGPISGTVDVTNPSTTVTGAFTSFLSQLVAGERLEFAAQMGTLYEIASITDDGTLILTTPYTGTTTFGTTATSSRPILANVTNAADPSGAKFTDFLRVGAGDVDHFWFKDATATEQWTEAQTNNVTWNTPSAGVQIIARDVAGNSINTYTTDGEDVRLITYETHASGTATAYNGGTFTVTFSGSAITAPATPDNLVLVNRRTGSIAKITGIAGTQLTLENPGLRFGEAADNTLVLNSDILDVLLRLNPTTWRFEIGDGGAGLNRNGGGSNDQPQILRSQFNFAGGTFSINNTTGGGATGFKWTGAIPTTGRIVVRPVINTGPGVFEHRGVRVGVGPAASVPTTGGLEVPINPGTVTDFLWTTAGSQRNAVPFTGVNTLTAVDVSGNVNTSFNGATTLTVQVASASRIPPTLTNFVSAAGVSPSTQFTTTDPAITSAVIGQTVHLFTNAGAPKAEAVIVAFDSGTSTLTTTTIAPSVYAGGGTPDQFVIDPVPPGATPTLTPAQINTLGDWSSGVANLTGLGFVYAGVGNGLSVTLTATSGPLVSATSNGIVMNPGDGAKVAMLYRGNGLGPSGSNLPDELVVQGAPSGAGGNPTLVRQLSPVVFPTQSLLAKVVVLDQNNNLVGAPGASTASVLNSDPFGTQGPQATAWNGSGEVPVSVLGRTVNGLVVPPATRNTPPSWSLSATSSGGFATPAGVSDRTFRVVTDGVQRVEYLLDHLDAATGTFNNTVNGDTGTATTLTLGVGTPFTASMVGMVVVNTTNAGAYGRITLVTPSALTFNALQGADPTRVGPIWQEGDAWRVVPMYHIDGMVSSIPLVPGVEGVINTRVLTAGTAVAGRVLLLDSGSNITASQLGDAVTVTTTDPFDAALAGGFVNGVFSFNLTPRQAAHSTGVPPATKDETDSFTISFHQLSISAAGPSIGGGVIQEGTPANPTVARYQIVPGPATSVLLLVSPPSQKIVRGDSSAPILGTPPLQTAAGAFLVQAYVVDQDNNPVNYDGTITYNLPFGGTTGAFTVTDGDTGNGSFVTINRFGAFLEVTPNNPVPNLTAPALLASSRFDVKPGAATHAVVYVSALTTGGGVETLSNGVSAAGDPPGSLALAGGTLAEVAGVDNVTVTTAVTDAFSNPVLLFELLPAGDRQARIVTTDPNNPAFDFNFNISASLFVPTYQYAGFPTPGTGMPLATLGRLITLTRAQLQHRLDVELATLADDIAVAPTPHQSRAIRINPGVESKAVIVLPGQTLNTGAKNGQAVFFGTPEDQVEGVEFPVHIFSVDDFFNRQFGDSASTLATLRTDEGTDYVGGLGFRLSGEGAVTLINSGQVEFTDLNGLVISPQLPFANGSTGAEVADEIEQAVQDQTIAVSEATTKFAARFLPEFARYLLVSGQATKGAGPTSAVVMGANTSAGLNLLAPGSGASGVLSPGGATFTTGVLAFTQQHAVAADVHFLRASVTIDGTPLVVQSENYRVLKPDFAFASVTMLDDGQGKIDRARIVFTLSADPSSIAGAASKFEVTQTMAGKVVSLLGNSISLLSTAAANDTIDVFFTGKLPTTAVANLTVSYTRPQSGGLRAELDSGGKLLDTTIRTNLNDAGEIFDGAVPALVNVTREDSDGNGGLDLMRFVFSEDVGFAAGAGFCKSGFGAGEVTVSGVDDGFLIELDGDGPQAVVLGELQTGTAVATALQDAVRAMTAADPLKQRAYDNFTATYDALNGRYLLRSGVGLAHDGTRHLVDWVGSSVVVTTSGVNTGATNLGLLPGVGFTQAGFGDAQPGLSVSSVAPLMEVTAGSADQLRLRLGDDAPRLISLSITIEAATTPLLDDRGQAIAARLQTVVRQIVSQSPSLQAGYDGFTALWDPTLDQLVLAAGVTGPRSTVVISATATPQDAGPSLGLGVLNGGTELAGAALSGALARPLEDLVILSQDGRQNLLSGRTAADVVVAGNRIDVRLSNVPASGTAMPRFLWLDAGDGGFVTDRAPAARSLPESTNVPGLDGRFAVVLDSDGVQDDVLKVSAGDTVLDATQSLPPLGSVPGTRVVYRWEQVDDTTDPATLVIDNGDGNPLGSSTLDFTSPTATILGATAPGDYDLRLVVTVVDQNGVPVPNAFTDGSGQVVREFRLQVADEPPVAIIDNADPLVVNGAVVLDGTPSLDPNGGTLSYQWSAEDTSDGSIVLGAFDDDTAAEPTFSPPGSGVFLITLRVASFPALPDAASPSDTIYVSNGVGGGLPPYADPGPDRTGRVRVPVILDGALSHPDDAQAYEWTVVSSPAPVQLVFNATTPGTVQFTPSSPGPYTLTLVVRDGVGLVSAPRTVTVMVVDDLAGAPRFPPVARPRVVGLSRAAFLDAAPANDLQSAVLDDGQPVTLAAFLPAGSPAPASGLIEVDVVVGGTIVSSAFVRVPTGRDVAALRLLDGTDSAVIGFAQNGDQLTLDGSQSQSATSVVSDFTWRQVGGPFAFSTRTGGILGLPVITGLYEFELIVQDSAGIGSRPARLKVQVLPTGSDGDGPPAAIATGPARIALGQSRNLDATDSVDRSGGGLTFAWEQVLGPGCAINNETTATPSVSPTAAGVYTFRVRVTDDNGVSDTAEVSFGVDGPTFEAPVATLAGASDLALAPGAVDVTATLTASSTTTSSGGQIEFVWTQLDGSPVFVDTLDSDASPRIRLRSTGRYVFAVRAVVSDATGVLQTSSAPATASFVVTGGEDVALVNGGFQTKSSGGCALSSSDGRSPSGPAWPLGALATLLLALRLRPAAGRARLVVAVLAAVTATGCGAAYYGSAAAIFASQKKTSKTVTTAPDPAVAAVEGPGMATLVVGTTLTQDGSGSSGLPLLEVRFPDGYGESRSDRGAGESTVLADELVISINGDEPQTITLAASSDGPAVAADIQVKVRALTPADPAVPAEAYTLFTCVFDGLTREYWLRSGVPGPDSAVAVNPADALDGPAAAATGESLRLGVANGGLERAGAENVRFTLFNHGNDVLPAGTAVNMYLSRVKGVDNESVLIRSEPTPGAVEVSKARRFTSRNQAVPRTVLAVASSGEVLFPPGQYYLVLELERDGDKIVDDNVRAMVLPVQVNAPFGGFPPVGGGPAPPATDPLDFAPVAFDAPIAVVTSARTVCSLTLSNGGAAVPLATPLTTDVILGTTDEFVPPTALSDPDSSVAGFFVNPIDVARQSSLVIDTTGVGPGVNGVLVTGSVVTATLDPLTTTVAGLAAALDANAAARAVLEARWDQVGDDAADTLDGLFTAAAVNGPVTLPTGGRLIHRETVTFAAAPAQQTLRTYVLDVELPAEDRFAGLPQRFTTFVRVTPPTGATPEDDSNNVRRSGNYTRVYGESTATFDNGVLLPTFRTNDFARLEPVTQRPVNTGSILQGQQRVFRFEIPSTGVALNESQLLVIVRTSTFDPHLELLDSTARPIARSDDSALGLDSMLYVPVAANQNQLAFYLVISNAQLEDSNIGGGGASFDLTISVNPRQLGDSSLTQAVVVEELFLAKNEPVADDPTVGHDENDKLLPFDLAQEKSEVMFVLPGRARVRFRTTPVFNVSVNPIITRFNEGEVPTALQFQAEVDPATLEIVYRPSGGTIASSHVLNPGVYTITFNSLEGPDSRDFILEVDADFIPQDVN